ncbi:MAG: DUF1614 domain-containing protein [Candidatus Bathyarchaeota archaeon]|nr:DUF1614 domain-containing protein [Candidatus Bathyarchaeota archaeon]
MSRKTIYFHHGLLFFVLLLFLAVTVVGLVFFGVVGFAFANVGFSPIFVLLILAASLFGSAVNIPVWKVKTTVPMIKDEYASFFGITYRIPRVEYGEAVTTIAVNVGGAIIPTAVSIYLLSQAELTIALYSIIGVAAVALVTYALARPVKGVGIVTPALIPPIAAALIAMILSPSQPLTIAYTAGVLGTLIGADLLNLRVIPKLGAPVASIGGAGTFDGVFLSGIFAVLLAGL